MTTTNHKHSYRKIGVLETLLLNFTHPGIEDHPWLNHLEPMRVFDIDPERTPRGKVWVARVAFRVCACGHRSSKNPIIVDQTKMDYLAAFKKISGHLMTEKNPMVWCVEFETVNETS